jgi:hypothetical protein
LERVIGKEKFRLTVVQNILNLLLAQSGIDRHKNSPTPCCRVIEGKVFQIISRHDSNPVTSPHAFLAQANREAICQIKKPLESQSPVTVYESQSVRKNLGISPHRPIKGEIVIG